MHVLSTLTGWRTLTLLRPKNVLQERTAAMNIQLQHSTQILGYKLGLAGYTAHCMYVSPMCGPSLLPACTATWASAWPRADNWWLLKPPFCLARSGVWVHLLSAAALVIAKVPAGHCVVGITEALCILQGGSPTRTKRSTGITLVLQQGTETNSYCKTGPSPIWPELWMPGVCFPMAYRWLQSPQPSPLSS